MVRFFFVFFRLFGLTMLVLVGIILWFLVVGKDS